MNTKVPVTEKALYQRINRKLRQRDEVLKRSRASTELDLGKYFVVDLHRNAVTSHHIDIEDFGKQIGVLADWESLQQ